MMDPRTRCRTPTEPRTARDVADRQRLRLSAVLLSAASIVFTVDMTPAASQAANEVVRPFLSSDFAASSRVQYLQATIGIKSQQMAPWIAYASALQAYREAVRDARDEDVRRILNDGQYISGGMRGNQVDAAKRDLKAKHKILYAALDQSQRLAADKTLTAGECGR